MKVWHITTLRASWKLGFEFFKEFYQAVTEIYELKSVKNKDFA